MNKTVLFDHIEVYVQDINKYCMFLNKIFQGGRYRIISPSGTAMFKSNDGMNIEIKKRGVSKKPAAAGYCNPCLRTDSAKHFIENVLKLEIRRVVKNPGGDCYFFTDHEGVVWHIKDYLKQDDYVNW